MCAPTCSSSVQAGEAAHWKPSTFTAAASTPPRTDGTLHRRWDGQQSAHAWQQRWWTVQLAPPVQVLDYVELSLATPCPHPPGAARKVGKEAGMLPMCQAWQDECPAGEGASGEQQRGSIRRAATGARCGQVCASRGELGKAHRRTVMLSAAYADGSMRRTASNRQLTNPSQTPSRAGQRT